MSSSKLRNILNNFRQSSIVIALEGSVRGAAEDNRAFDQSLAQSEEAIKSLFLDTIRHSKTYIPKGVQKTLENEIKEL